jgi:hypothetical protein
METIYRLNTRELANTFIDSLRSTYPNQDVEIMVRERDETEYLLSSPANREHLLKSVEDLKQERNIRYFDTLEDAIACAESK